MREEDLSYIYYGDVKGISDKSVERGREHTKTEENAPVFSVMMTVYNDTSLLNSAINSCLRQSFPEWELLILDNSDTGEEAWRMIQCAAAREGRIRAYRSEKNVGWAKGSAVLLEHARGEYVTFLSADDCLHPDAFAWLREVVQQENPDVIFVGNAYTTVNQQGAAFLGAISPEYRIYYNDNRPKSLLEIMKNVYYNSMFHYEKRQFLIENNLNFFSPYYADCATMTYAVKAAEKIVVLDKIIYFLTMNTSQSAGYYGKGSYEYIFLSQWRSVKSIFFSRGSEICREEISYAAARIFNNLAVSLKALCSGKWRDKYMNGLQVTLTDIFGEMEALLSAGETGELFFLMGSEGIDKLVQNIASIRKYPVEEVEKAAEKSWLRSLFRITLWRRKLSETEKLDCLCEFLLEEENRWCIGFPALEVLQAHCGERAAAFREKIKKAQEKYCECVQQYAADRGDLSCFVRVSYE